MKIKADFSLFVLLLVFLISCKPVQELQCARLKLSLAETSYPSPSTCENSLVEKIRPEAISEVQYTTSSLKPTPQAQNIFIKKNVSPEQAVLNHSIETHPEEDTLNKSIIISTFSGITSLILSFAAARMIYLAAAVLPGTQGMNAIGLALLFGILALITGIISLVNARKSGKKKTLGVIGITLGAIALGISFFALFHMLLN